jgi:hypothetical protein
MDGGGAFTSCKSCSVVRAPDRYRPRVLRAQRPGEYMLRKRAALVCAALVAVVLSACGSAKQHASAPPTAPHSAPGQPQTSTAAVATTTTLDRGRSDLALAQASRPTTADLPGWTLTSERHLYADSTNPGLAACEHVSFATIERHHVPGTLSHFERASAASLDLFISIYPDAPSAYANFVADTSRGAPSCAAANMEFVEISQNHLPVTGRASTFISAPRTGDHSGAYRVSLDFRTRTISEDYVYVVRGRALLTLITDPLDVNFEAKFIGKILRRLALGGIAAAP